MNTRQAEYRTDIANLATDLAKRDRVVLSILISILVSVLIGFGLGGRQFPEPVREPSLATCAPFQNLSRTGPDANWWPKCPENPDFGQKKALSRVAHG